MAGSRRKRTRAASARSSRKSHRTQLADGPEDGPHEAAASSSSPGAALPPSTAAAASGSSKQSSKKESKGAPPSPLPGDEDAIVSGRRAPRDTTLSGRTARQDTSLSDRRAPMTAGATHTAVDQAVAALALASSGAALGGPGTDDSMFSPSKSNRRVRKPRRRKGRAIRAAAASAMANTASATVPGNSAHRRSTRVAKKSAPLPNPSPLSSLASSVVPPKSQLIAAPDSPLSLPPPGESLCSSSSSSSAGGPKNAATKDENAAIEGENAAAEVEEAHAAQTLTTVGSESQPRKRKVSAKPTRRVVTKKAKPPKRPLRMSSRLKYKSTADADELVDESTSQTAANDTTDPSAKDHQDEKHHSEKGTSNVATSISSGASKSSASRPSRAGRSRATRPLPRSDPGRIANSRESPNESERSSSNENAAAASASRVPKAPEESKSPAAAAVGFSSEAAPVVAPRSALRKRRTTDVPQCAAAAEATGSTPAKVQFEFTLSQQTREHDRASGKVPSLALSVKKRRPKRRFRPKERRARKSERGGADAPQKSERCDADAPRDNVEESKNTVTQDISVPPNASESSSKSSEKSAGIKAGRKTMPTAKVSLVGQAPKAAKSQRGVTKSTSGVLAAPPRTPGALTTSATRAQTPGIGDFPSPLSSDGDFGGAAGGISSSKTVGKRARPRRPDTRSGGGGGGMLSMIDEEPPARLAPSASASSSTSARRSSKRLRHGIEGRGGRDGRATTSAASGEPAFKTPAPVRKRSKVFPPLDSENTDMSNSLGGGGGRNSRTHRPSNPHLSSAKANRIREALNSRTPRVFPRGVAAGAADTPSSGSSQVTAKVKARVASASASAEKSYPDFQTAKKTRKSRKAAARLEATDKDEGEVEEDSSGDSDFEVSPKRRKMAKNTYKSRRAAKRAAKGEDADANAKAKANDGSAASTSTSSSSSSRKEKAKTVSKAAMKRRGKKKLEEEREEWEERSRRELEAAQKFFTELDSMDVGGDGFGALLFEEESASDGEEQEMALAAV